MSKAFDISKKRAPMREPLSILSRILPVKLAKAINVDNIGQKPKLFKAGLGNKKKQVETM